MTLAPNSKEKIIQKAIAIQGRVERLRRKMLPMLTPWQRVNLNPAHEIAMIEKAASEIIEEIQNG